MLSFGLKQRCIPNLKKRGGFEDSLYAAEVLADQHFGAVGIYDTDEAGTIEQLEQVCDVVLRELDELDIDKFLRGEYRKN